MLAIHSEDEHAKRISANVQRITQYNLLAKIFSDAEHAGVTVSVRGDSSLVFGPKHVEEKYFKHDGLFDKSKTNLYINHKDNERFAAVEQPAAVQFPGLIVRQHGHKLVRDFSYPNVYILKKTARKQTVNSSFYNLKFF